MKSNEKIALFCSAYEKHIGVKYKVAPPEAGKIKQVEVSEAHLQAWFTSKMWWAKTKTLGRYIRYFNELCEDMHTQKNSSRFPDYYDAVLEKHLDVKDLQAYWQHLHSVGLRPVKRNGQTIDWKKSE